jgi:glycosyltransferase involved in cell wall biosynthesis
MQVPGGMTDTLLFFQNGDYREAYERFQSGGEETYLDQRRSVEFVAALARKLRVVVASASAAAHDTVLAPGLRSIGIPLDRFWTDAVGKDVIAEVRPTRVIPRTGHAGLLRRIRTAATPCFPTLADIFQPIHFSSLASLSGLKQRVHRQRQRALFSVEHALAVGNHGLNASRSLHSELGVPLDRIVPWEWTRLAPDAAPRQMSSGRLSDFYAGMVTENKGTGDLVEAVRLLREAGHDVEVTICGVGDGMDGFKARAAAQGLGDRVHFLGRVPLERVGGYMRACDIVVVPSRHAYPEGMPNVIFEALSARTPLVVSDHPSFRGRLEDGESAVVFPASDPRALAAAIAGLAGDTALYTRLSERAGEALRGLYVGESWYVLVEQFLDDPENRTGWVETHSLRAVMTDRARKGREAHGCAQ